MNISRAALETDIGAIVSPVLAKQLVTSYVEMQQRYFSGDWKPTELDGGHFCEAVARALYQIDTGNPTTELPGKVIEYLLDKVKTPGSHKLERKDRDHYCRVLQTIYKFRSDRGVAHISPTYTANYADASLTVMGVKWMFAEFLRVAWNSDRNKVAAIIEAITQLEHPLVHELDGKPLVLSTALSASEEVLVLLSRSAGGRLTRDELKTYVQNTPNAVSTAISRLISSRHVRVSDTGEIVITPTGEQRVREVILPGLEKNSAKAAVRRRVGCPRASQKGACDSSPPEIASLVVFRRRTSPALCSIGHSRQALPMFRILEAQVSDSPAPDEATRGGRSGTSGPSY